MLKKLIFAAVLLPFSVYALELSGVYKQGGLVHGKTKPNNIVTVNGVKTKTASDGSFVFGLQRHFPLEAKVVSTDSKGHVKSQTVLVEPRDYKTQRIKGVKKKHVNPSPKNMKRIKADKAEILAARKVFSEDSFFNNGFVWPVKDRISGVYGSRRFYNGEERNWHKGVDVAAPTGTPVYAPSGAKVVLALDNSFFNGNLVILDHGHQIFTIYAHLDSMTVKKGDILNVGEKLGEVGSTGRSTGPHLHWGMYWRNIALDPQLFVKEK